MNKRDDRRAPDNLAGGRPADSGQTVLARRSRLVEPLLPWPRHHLLDYGCGNGAQTMLFAQVFDQITGVDVNPEYLADFNREIALRNLGQLMDAHSLEDGRIPLEDGAVDCLMSFTVLEHVDDEMAVLKEMYRVLKPGGKLILTVPNRWWIFETHGANLPLLPWNRVPFVSWWPKFLHDRYARARIYRKREIRAMVEEAGFTVTDNFNMTAPMDMIKWRPLRRFLQATIFRSDRIHLPTLSTEIMLAAQR